MSSYDDAVTIMALNSEWLERWYRFITPPWEIARNLFHKDLTYKAAKEVGIDSGKRCHDSGGRTLGFWS